MAPVTRKIYDQIPEPKYVIAIGSCATSGNIFQTAIAWCRESIDSCPSIFTCQGAPDSRGPILMAFSNSKTASYEHPFLAQPEEDERRFEGLRAQES